MLTICPTADYEVYLGKNLLPPEDVLFEPTRKLLEVWAAAGVRGTLFPDICSVWRHRELEMDAYADRFEEQMCTAARLGHDLQLHLHPEWATAQYSRGAWSFIAGTGSLHSRGFDAADPQGAPALIRKGKQFLEDLAGALQPGYRCIAFRAGGWILQPEGPLLAALQVAGIRVDATVIPGVVLVRTDHRVDFRNVPDRTHWRVDPQLGLSQVSQRHDALLEISIGAYRGSFPLLHHVLAETRLRRRARQRPEPFRGLPMVKVGPKPGVVGKLSRKWRKLTIPRPFDIADAHEAMLATLRSYLRRYDCRNEEHVICMNGHPKDTYDYHLDELRRFFDVVRSRHSDVVRFETLAACVGRLEGLPA